MGENRARHGRNLDYGWRGRIAALSGVGVMSVALIMMLSPAASAVSAGTVYVAPYKGVVSPSNNFNLQNCAHVKNVKAMHLSLKTGIGVVANTGGTKSCKGVASNLESFANDYNTFEAAIPVKITAGQTSVAVNSAWKVTGSASATIGAHPVCAGGSSYDDQYTYADWGYTGSYFPYYNDTYNYSGHLTYYGYTLPSPFNFNNTSSYSHYVDYGAYSSCSVMGEWSVTSNAHLLDATTGVQTAWDASTVPAWVSVGEVEISQSIDWYCYGTPISWYGPTGTWSNTTVTCNSYNTTLTSLVFNGLTSATGNNTTQLYSNTSAGAGSYYFNSTTATVPGAQNFSLTDSYDVIIEVANDMNIASGFSYYYAGSWCYGYTAASASWSINMATLGNGWDLKSVTVT